MYNNPANPDSDAQRSERFLLTFHVLLVHYIRFQMEDGKIVSRTPLQIRFVGGRRTERLYLLAELLGNKNQIENVDSAIAIGVWGGFTEPVGDLHQIQDVDFPNRR